MLFSKLAKIRVQLPRGIPLRRPGITLRVRLDPSAEPANDAPVANEGHSVEDTASPTPSVAPPPKASETTVPFGLAVVFTALLSALLTTSLIVALRPSEPSSRATEAEERRARFAALDELRQLALERQRLEALLDSADSGDRRLDEEWGYLGNAAGRLVEHQERSIAQASALSERLSILAERARELSSSDDASGGGSLPESLRPELRRLRRQAETYLQILRREIDRLEDHRDTLVRQIERAELDRRQITLEGIRVRIIHDAERLADAEELAGSLGRAGASVELYPTTLTETGRYKGRLYYRAGAEEAAARRIARLAEPVELIEIEAVGVPSPFISLWIVGSRAPGLDDEPAPPLLFAPDPGEENPPVDDEP